VRRRLRGGAAALAACALLSICWMTTAGAAVATGGGASLGVGSEGEQPLRIPLEPMGFQTLLPEFLLAGASSLTVDFVDNDHLLVTFNTRHLMKREKDEQPDDDDRMIAAVLVELPSGKVLARTEWRVHDRLQYLWNLGHGRFLLRVRDQLTVIAPLQAMAGGDAFRGTPLLNVERHVVAVLLSSDADLLTIETTRKPGAPGEASDVSFAGMQTDTAPVQINFYRLSDTPGGLVVAYAGAVRTQVALAVPMTPAGFLDVLDGGRNRWLFNFDEHAGKVDELAEWDTSCFPRATFVGHGEFVAFGCRGSADKIALAGFDLKGEEMWEQGLYESYVSPTFAFAPAAGRFALGRTIVSAPLDADAPLPGAAVVGQEVRVYQTHDGRVLLKIDCSPVERAGQNFALSPDGLRLAVVRQTVVRHAATKTDDAYTETSTAVEVYPLPALTDPDRAAVKQAEQMAPTDTGARIDASLERLSIENSADQSEVARRTAAKDRQETAARPEPGNPAVTAKSAPSLIGLGGAGGVAAGGSGAASAAGSGAGSGPGAEAAGTASAAGSAAGSGVAAAAGAGASSGKGAGAGSASASGAGGTTATAAAGSTNASGAGGTTAAGDDAVPDAPGAPRKPPTLYGPDEKPGDKPQTQTQ